MRLIALVLSMLLISSCALAKGQNRYVIESADKLDGMALDAVLEDAVFPTILSCAQESATCPENGWELAPEWAFLLHQHNMQHLADRLARQYHKEDLCTGRVSIPFTFEAWIAQNVLADQWLNESDSKSSLFQLRVIELMGSALDRKDASAHKLNMLHDHYLINHGDLLSKVQVPTPAGDKFILHFIKMVSSRVPAQVELPC